MTQADRSGPLRRTPGTLADVTSPTDADRAATDDDREATDAADATGSVDEPVGIAVGGHAGVPVGVTVETVAIGTPPPPEPVAHARSTVINVSAAPKERRPLNPAIAILAGAILTATSGITAAFLSIRSSERLSNERAKTDAAVKSSTDLQRKVDQLQRDLSDASRQIKTLGTTIVPTTPVSGLAPPPSIVVVVNTPPTPSTVAATAIPATVPPTTGAPPTTVAVTRSTATTVELVALPTTPSGPSSSTPTSAPSTTSTTTSTAVSTTTKL